MKFQRFSFSLLLQLKSGTKRDIVLECLVELLSIAGRIIEVIML